jgi:hypothetical protein
VAHDLLGRELDPVEQRLLDVYEGLKAVCREDLPPVAHTNARAALAVYANLVNGLGLAYEQLADLDV